jgi:hypothetical protein
MTMQPARSDVAALGLDRFLAYPSTLAAISERAQGVGMGRWTITVNTRVGSFLLESPSHRFDVPVDYPDARRAIYAIRDAIEDDFEAAWPAISAMQAWIDNRLQSFAATLAAAGAGADFDVALTAAIAARDVCASAAQALATAAANQPKHVDAVRALHDTITDESMRRCAELHAALADQPAGRDDALAQFSVLQSILATSQAKLTEAVHDLVHETTAVLGELEALVRAAEQLVTDLERCRSLVDGGVDRDVVVSSFDLSSMAKPWAALAASTADAPDDRLLTPLRPASLRARATRRRD